MNLSKILLIAVLFATASRAGASEYYVAPDGDDRNPGTAEKPLATVAKAVNFVLAGDTIRLRGGRYTNQKRIRLLQSGTESRPIRILAAEGETPILDFSDSASYGIQIKAAWWHLKGLTITGAKEGGIRILDKEARRNILENITAEANHDTGFTLSKGAADNTLLNCDSFLNYDPHKHGENADGFGLKHDIGPGNRLIGCRAWSNSDDGFDCWHAGNPVLFERCLAWKNGLNIWNDSAYEGDGNGFKLGQREGAHRLLHCAAWDHPQHGFDLNGNTTGVTVLHCTAFRNPVNFDFTFILDAAEQNRLRNNLSYRGNVSIDPRIDDRRNSWNLPGLTITDEDFLSLDSAGLEGPRQPTGDLPESDFLRLAPGSSAVDAGLDIGLPYCGEAPDLGAFEHGCEKTNNLLQRSPKP